MAFLLTHLLPLAPKVDRGHGDGGLLSQCDLLVPGGYTDLILKKLWSCVLTCTDSLRDQYRV